MGFDPSLRLLVDDLIASDTASTNVTEEVNVLKESRVKLTEHPQRFILIRATKPISHGNLAVVCLFTQINNRFKQ